MGPPDQDDEDFLQLFAQGTLFVGEDPLLVKAGRQTRYYGSGRVLSRRKGANFRLSQDAVIAAACQDGFPEHGNFKSLLWRYPIHKNFLQALARLGFSAFEQWQNQLLSLLLEKVHVAIK